MRNWVRVLIGMVALMALMLLAACSGAPGCTQVTFGGAGCSTSGSGSGFGSTGGTGGGGGGGGGGSNATPTAYVYAVDETGGGSDANGTIDGFDLSNSAGSFLTLSGYTAPQIDPNDGGAAMTVVNKQFVYAVFATSGQLGGWSIDAATGGLTVIPGFPMAVTLDSNNANYFGMTTDPGGNYLFISSTEANLIYVYAINSTTGVLTLAPGSPVSTTGSGVLPGNLTTDGLGRFLYVCSDSLHGAATGGFEAYTIGTGGALTFIPGSFVGGAAINMWEVQGDASGKYLIGTSGSNVFWNGYDDLHLYVFSINQTTGIASATSGSPVSTVYSPFTIAVQPASSNGEFVYSFSANDAFTAYNGIEGYQLNPSTGALTAVTGSPFSNGLTLGYWGQFDQSGSNLLEYTAEQSGTLIQIAPLQVSSSGALTEPVSPITLVTPGYWVVTDP
jgi:hypothetical protein